MIQIDKIFQNYFDDVRITAARFSNFAADHIVRVNNIDTDGVFKAATADIVAAYTPFYKGLSSIDTSLVTKKGKTMTVKEVRKGFGTFMSEYENEIARSLGGRSTPNYVAFYPRGVSEFTKATIKEMPILVQRIYTLATDNAALLGKTVTPLLQAFNEEWKAAITDQSTVKGTLSDGRAGRDTLRYNLEIALLAAIHLVGYNFPGDAAKCMSFFDFSLLVGVSHKAQVISPKPILA